VTVGLKAVFDGVGLKSAFDGDGIEVIRPAWSPDRPTVGRSPLQILDLRTKSEDAYLAASPAHKPWPRHQRFMQVAYAKDPPVKEDVVFRAEEVTLFRTGVWHRGQPVQGSVMARSGDDVAGFNTKVERLAETPNIPRRDGTSAVIQGPGARNYFHWTTEIMPRLYALRDYIQQGHGRIDRILLFYAKPDAYITDSIRIFFPDLEPLCEYATETMLKLERCLFFVDPRSYVDTGSRFKTTTARFSDELERRLATDRRKANRVIIVSRGDAPTRRLVNEPELTESLKDLGAECIPLGTLDFAGQMALMAEARLLIGAHGAGLTNMMFCRPGCGVIEITSTQYIRRSRSYADIAMYRRMPYALAVVDQHGENWVITKNRGNDLEIAPSGLQRIREVAESFLATGPIQAEPEPEPAPEAAASPARARRRRTA
jgi:capsular polysaccharide biosynthesis protein